MKALIKKASDSYWYEIKEIENIEQLFAIFNSVVVTKGNEYKNWSDDFMLLIWDGLKKEDCEAIRQCECEILIYDSYIE